MSSTNTRGNLGFILANERDAPSVLEQPCVEVHSWRLVQLPSGDQHLVTLRDRETARVTSAIAKIDLERRTIATSSGRLYVLLGPPEVRDMECKVLRAAASGLLGRPDAVDISVSTWGQMCGV